MLTTLVRHERHDWLIIGSNGAIGSEVTYVLANSSTDTTSACIQSKEYAHSSYTEASIDLVQRHNSRAPLRILYCGGKGGFSLNETSCAQQYQDFEYFCEAIKQTPRLEKVILISSLGVQCSSLESPYRSLMAKKENSIVRHLADKSLILRLPSIYGYNRHTRRHHGLIGVMHRNLRQRKSTDIYARMETRRNYLSISHLVPELLRSKPGGRCIDGRGIVNVQAAISLSVFDLCKCYFHSIHLRPCVRLKTPSPIDAEDHHPSRLTDAKLIINDQLCAWIKWQWMRHSLPSRS
jgi:hypothetical protein